MNFISLRYTNNAPAIPNVDRIIDMTEMRDGTTEVTYGSNVKPVFKVKETPEQIMEKIKGVKSA